MFATFRACRMIVLSAPQAQMHPNKAFVAGIAAKMAKVVWVCTDQAWSTLRTQRSCFRLTLFAQLQGPGIVMDETVDQRAVSPVKKGLRARIVYWERRVPISS
ncbi:hypothetical protein [Rhizobium tibeticum]|uniref:Uncharacterized protein n=1 Tax=Rhizobium tibeticum TaxID=501024 RepID=A0A1H8WT00_9HYPH|nr:hypothetical protein [Rhizobium tibeticum]SEI21430.1 hypothetical protein RTCCBAU85039_6631 [Rhizobium tibeticum]SEP30795.1 hypothetical protein SAMN05216228_10778 [Rhizobium tibeticum]